MLTGDRERTAVIRTSDRNLFKTCRRRWGWQSHMQQNREPKQAAAPLWFGTAIHFALEDYFGEKRYDRASAAFEACIKATAKQNRQELPDNAAEQLEMGRAMMDYMQDMWLVGRDPLKTYVHNGIPQTEVNFLVDIPFDVKAHFPDSPYDKVIYSGTIDRVVIDDNGDLWLVDYKTAKALKGSHYENDAQISAYTWAASHIYDRPVVGMIWWQFLKTVPKKPQPLKSGKISTAQNQRTSHRLYRQGLIDHYGAMEKVPEEQMKFLNQLAMTEGAEADAYIRRDRVYKNPSSLQAEGLKILLEMEDMLNPNLPMYPNPTFMCPSMCPFYEACVSMDDGSDWEHTLDLETQSRPKSEESWRAYLDYELNKPEEDISLKEKDFD